MLRRLAIFVAAAAFVASACGGTGTGQPTGGPGDGSAGPGGETAGPGGAAATPAGNGQGTSGSVCSLLTVEEAAGAMTTDPLTTKETAGDPATCSYLLTEDDEALNVQVLVNGAQAQFQLFLDSGSTEPVAGVGDQALFDSNGRVVFMAGGRMYFVYPRYVGARDALLAAGTKIGRIIAARATGAVVPPDAALTAPPLVAAVTACDLLAAESAAAALGKDPMTASGGPPEFCTYSVVSTGEVVVSVYFMRKEASSAWPGLIASLTTNPVAGLGEEARYEPSTGMLFVRRGDAYFTVNVFTLDGGSVLDDDQTLAEIMLGNL